MKILHVLDHSIPLHSGYTFRTAAILHEQRQRGWDTVQLTTPRQGASPNDVEDVEGLRFYRTRRKDGFASVLPGLWPIDEMWATYRRLLDVAGGERPDVIHAHSPALNAWPSIRAGRKLGIPVVYEVRALWEDAAVDHGTTQEGSLRYRLTRGMETAALRRVAQVTTICEGLRGDIVARGIDPSRVTVIPNAVDASRFTMHAERDEGLARSLGLTNAEVVGFCGSFYAYEGLDLLIESLPELLAARPRARVLLVGGGPREDMLRRQAAAVCLADRVVFTGRVPHRDVERYYGLIDVVVFPRHRMRLTELVTPLKPLEAMAQGIPVVASDVGGHRELVRHGVTGLLFPAGDKRGLAAAVAGVLADRERRQRMAAAGRAFVESERTWSASVARYQSVYDAALRG